jgi:type I restriction enzyme S subunit
LQERSRKARAALKAIPPLLEQFRQSVLAAAFRGDLTADWRAQHPDVEPASVLLDRIRAERRRRWEEAELAKMQAKGKMPKDEKWKEKYKEPEIVDETDLSELPEGWCWARAEQICGLITKGTTPAKNKMFSENGDIPFVKVYNLTDKGILDFTVNPTFVSEKTHSTELARSRILPGDVLMNIVGPPLGKVSIVPETYPEWNMNQAMAVFRSLSGYDRSFLAFCLLTDQILSAAVLRAKATAGQFNLTLEICRDLPLPVSPEEEQKHIVSKLKLCLSTVESLEISVASKLELLDQLDQSILAKAFRGELIPQDPNDEPASVLLERIRAEREAQSAKPRAKKKTPGSTKRTKKAPPVSVNENDELPLFSNLQK